MTGCLISGCTRAHHANGFCSLHSHRLKRHGDPLAGGRERRPKRLSEEDAFRWFMPGDPPVTGCWDWTASASLGYGQFSITTNGRRRIVKAHIAAYKIFKGPTNGLDVLHDCDRKICCHPDHLHLGTAADNSAEAVDRGLIPVGESCRWAKLTESDVLAIRSSPLPQKVLAEQYRVSQSLISKIANRKNWTHV